MESNRDKTRLNLVSVGQIISTFGIKGEVKIKILTDFPDRFLKQKEFFLTTPDLTQKIFLEGIRFQKNILIAKIKSCDSLESAKKLKWAYLQIEEKELINLTSDTFYHFQIIDSDVYSLENRYLGKIKDIIKTGSNDVYVIKTSKEELLVPATKEFIKKIDLSKKTIYIKIPEVI